MAIYMFFYPVRDEHLLFLRDNPAAFDAYLAGQLPELKPGLISRLLGKRPPELPGDWPGTALVSYSPEINHRQVNAFHYLLNGHSDLVDHVGCVFQTWFKRRHNTPAMVIDGDNFALDSAHTKQLLEMIECLTPELIRARLEELGGAAETEHDGDSVKNAFDEIGRACREAVSKDEGLLWTNR